ncbi:MAG: agmatine deiminase [Gammaproteobacteria bacterium]|nr:MAG: agmatine deiminase [Gammaproteobacteria bacterium]
MTLKDTAIFSQNKGIKTITNSTPKADGYAMPAEYAKQSRVFMIFPERPDNWRDNAKPAQIAFANVAQAISNFTPVTMLVSHEQFQTARNLLAHNIQLIEISTNDAWARDIIPTFVQHHLGKLRLSDWHFNAWGGEVDGLYSPYDKDDMVGQKISELMQIDRYRPNNFVLEGGAIHVDGEGTVLTTRMCLLSEGRNPNFDENAIENLLKEYLGVTKVLWLDDGIDPEETNGHIDDVACFVRPSEVVCIYTDDPKHPFYTTAQQCYRQLSEMTDAKGRKLTVHKICCTKQPVYLPTDINIKNNNNSKDRTTGELCIASYANFLITNNGIIAPQYDDENDELALQQLRNIFPNHTIVGVQTREIVYGGGNIHCITQQLPAQPL